MTGTQQATHCKYKTCYTKSAKILSTKQLFFVNEAVKNIQKNIGATTELKQYTVTNNTGGKISFGHSIYFFYMEF